VTLDEFGDVVEVDDLFPKSPISPPLRIVAEIFNEAIDGVAFKFWPLLVKVG
jgi:hypothetical protein